MNNQEVYILLVSEPYEYTDVLGVFSSAAKALQAKKAWLEARENVFGKECPFDGDLHVMTFPLDGLDSNRFPW